MKKTNKKGFTIVELVIVIAVIAILAAVLIPTFAGVIEKAQKNAALQNARNELTMYVADADGAAVSERVSGNYVIKSGEYYFVVTSGTLNTTAYTSSNVSGSVLTAGTSTYTFTATDLYTTAGTAEIYAVTNITNS